MGCFPCFSSKKSESIQVNEHIPVIQTAEIARPALPSSSPAVQHKHKPSGGGGESKEAQTPEVGNIEAKTFTFRELATATKNFRQETLLGDGGFGKFYKGTLQPSGQVIAVKRLDRNGVQGNKEFLVEVFMLSLLKHPNILDLVGYCADGDQRLLVYDYMPLGSLESHLFDDSPDKKPLDWETRMKIASGAAQGLEYLHEKANPPVVYRDMKPTNILLGEGFEARLCDIGITKNAQSGNSTPPRVMNTHGYCAPEYTRTGEVTLKSDIYSFGVVLLELITGRRAMDPNRPSQEQNLVTWAQPIFRDPKRFPEMADPLLNGKFSVKCLNQAVGVAAMCLEEEPSVRPFITDVVAALSFLQLANKDETSSTNELLAPTPSLKGDDHHDDEDDISDQSSEDSSSDHEEDHCNTTNELDHEGRSCSSDDHDEEGEDDRDEEGRSCSSDEHDEEGEDAHDEEERSCSSDDHDEEGEEDISEKHPVDHDVYSGSDEDGAYEISQKCQRKSIKSRRKENNMLSDDESIYSSSTRSSTSSAANDE